MIDRKAEISRQSAVGSPQKNKVILILLAIFLTISLPLQVFAEKKDQKKEDPVSNEEFLRESVRNVFHKAFVDFPRAESKFVFVNSEEENPANWLLEDELVSYLQSKNLQVALHPGGGQNEFPKAWSLFYHIIEMKLSYPQVKRKGFFGHKLVTRKAKLNLSFRLEEKRSGRVLWTKRETEERSDVVKKQTIRYLNNDSYSFLSPSLPEDLQAKYIEPALVAAVVGGLIYLFFASR
ncbi:MAG: hypothetical protein KAW52_03765 [candidate division Zixibacteria bacterium]|nr:hypothetical protein [candidate division Zixibacteria bacterium]